MALIAREGAEVKVLLKNVFPNLIEAPSVGKDRGEVAPQESYEKKKSSLHFPSLLRCLVSDEQQILSQLVTLGKWDLQSGPSPGRTPAPWDCSLHEGGSPRL